MSRRFRLIRSALVALLLLPVAAAADDPCSSAITLPLSDGPNGAVLIQARIGGSPVALMIDTGASLGLLREAVVDQLHLPRVALPLNGGGAGVGGGMFREGTLVDQLALGGVVMPQAAMVIEPRSHGRDEAMSGLIGADLLGRYDLALDFQRRVAVLEPPGACPPPDHAVTVPITLRRSGHIILTVEIDGRPVQAVLDTGASHSTMNLDAAHDLFGISRGSPLLLPAGTTRGADGGLLATYRYPFHSLAVGGVTIADPAILLIPDETRRMHIITPNGTDRTGAGPEGFPDLLLGIAELRRFRLVIAYRTATLYLAGYSSKP